MNQAHTSRLRSRIAGFQVLVHQGKEVTAAQVAKLTGGEALAITTRVNGPHHQSEWAKHLLGTSISQNQYRRNRLATA